ncbi:hypothetical protein [[Mycobacterium] wendilense]|uniref:ESX-1 secretion-associated protein EspA/EspE-like domain-containing protein n=1 Tax=[Mycobacterium] wendilense TaxID=3064284 RepID=A0ABN9NTI4_9MYCO|nr:hypothetical protein [Mycolicibacterium sp. MU0050]CAJ1579253.1 hypothetical protein MU0050_000415 [Mycolicibacterium sp. MU0050]
MASTGAGTPTRSQIEGWDGTHLRAAAQRWTATAETWDQAFEALHQEALAPGGTDFDGATAAATRQRTVTDKLTVIRISEDLVAAATAAKTGVDSIATAKSAALDAIARAEEAGFDVGDDLSLTSRQEFTEAEFDAKLAEAQLLAAEIRTAAANLAQADAGVATAVTTAVDSFAATSFAEPTGPGEPARGPFVRAVSNETPGDQPAEEEGDRKAESGEGDPQDEGSRALQDLLLPDGAAETPGDEPDEAEAEQPEDLDGALATVAGGHPIPPPTNVLDRFKDQMKGSVKGDLKDGAEVPYTKAPLAAPIVAADPSVVDDQVARVDAARQAVDAAQAELDAVLGQNYTQGPGGGPNRDVGEALAQTLFEARRDLTEQTRILERLSQARADLGGQPVGIPELPRNADVQAFPEKSLTFADASRALSEGSFGLIPDVAHDIEVFRNWGEHSGAEQIGAVLDVAGAIPFPGGKAFSEALQQALDAASTAGRHADDIPTGAHRGVEAPDGPNQTDAPGPNPVDDPDYLAKLGVEDTATRSKRISWRAFDCEPCCPNGGRSGRAA